MSHLYLTLFGAFQAQLDNQPLTTFHSVKVQGLLAYLAVEGSRSHARESLTALFWPDDAPQSAQQSLRQALYALRRTLGDADKQTGEPFLLVTRQTVQFNPAAAYTLDVATFLQQVQQGNPEQAAALYTAELLTGLTTDSAPFEEWLRTTRQYLHNLALNALNQLTQQQLDRGDYRQAALYARRQLTLEPWCEEAHRQVMTALAHNGDRSAALAQYESCRRVLVDELGVEPAAETTTLYTQIRNGQIAGKVSTPSLPPVIVSSGHPANAPPRHNLPPQPTPFIGRQTDLAQIAARLQDPTCRLLTIVGPGGMGKTRLAIQAAQTTLDWGFTDGVFFVALAGVGSPDLLVSTIAAAVDFTFYGSGDPKTQLLDYLRTKTLLLLLDNCEHLLDGIELVADLLAAAPKLKLLATSREPLNLREEWLHTLSGMSFPRTGENGARLEEYTAVQLFVQCARRMKPAFDLTAESRAVVQICQLVDGMPLGIELAATWLKFYSCPQIIQEMQRSLDFLATTLRNLPARHRSMRAVFEHSWQLLPAAEQQVLQRLAVFRGGFTQVAAEQVAGASRAVLLALVEKSLVQQIPTRRFQFHELMRQFAEEKLFAEPQVTVEVKERHCLYYLLLLKQQEAYLKERKQLPMTAILEADIENFRTAWQWGVAHQKVDEIDGTLESLYLFYLIKYWFQEGETVLGQAVATLRMDEPVGKKGILIGKLLVRQGVMAVWFAWTAGEASYWEKGAALYQESVTILTQFDAPAETALAISALGALHFHLGKFEQANQSFEQALRIFTAQDNRVEMGRILHELGVSLAAQGNYQEAIQTLQHSSELCEQSGDLRMQGEVLTSLARVHIAMEEYATAEQMTQAILSARTAAGDQRGMASSLALLGDLAWRMDNYTTAQHYSEESLSLLDKIGLNKPKEVALNNLGNIACSLADYRQAHEHFRTVLTINLATGRLHYDRHVAVALTGMAIVLGKQGQLMQATELLHVVLCQPATWQEVKNKATQLLDAMTAQLPAGTIAATQGRTQAQDLTPFVLSLLAAHQSNNS